MLSGGVGLSRALEWSAGWGATRDMSSRGATAQMTGTPTTTRFGHGVTSEGGDLIHDEHVAVRCGTLIMRSAAVCRGKLSTAPPLDGNITERQ